MDRSSDRWQHAKTMCLMITGSTPSGRPEVVEARNNLCSELFGPGHLHDFLIKAALVAPTVDHDFEAETPSAARVRVGWGNCASSLTPWSCPLLPCEYTAAAATRIIHTRADAKVWLSRLSGKILECECMRESSSCWAQLLRSEFIEAFGNDEEDRDTFVYAVAEDEVEEEEPMPFEAYITIPDTFECTRQSESLIPHPVPWPPSWTALVQTIRTLERPVAWEVFCGMAVLTNEFEALGVTVAPPLDAARNPDYDLLNASFIAVVVGVLMAGCVCFAHFAPPCSTFSVALNGCKATRVRTWDQPGGIEDLTPKQRHQVAIGNALATATAAMINAQHKVGNLFQLEQPAGSMMVAFKPIKDALSATGARAYQRDACADGAPWKKPLLLHTATHEVGQRLVAICPGCKNHVRLRGLAPNGIDWTKVASPYWPAWARQVAEKWSAAMWRRENKMKRMEQAPMMITDGSVSHSTALRNSRFVPSGGRSLIKAADVLATGVQPTRKALPQLIPDGLPPELHLQAALSARHPLSYPPESTEPVEYALRHAPDNLEGTRERRARVCKLVRVLTEACAEENNELLEMVEPEVKIVLTAFGTKNVALMRELAYVCGSRDIASPSLLLLGIPMLGWAPVAEGLMERSKPPEISVDEFLAESAGPEREASPKSQAVERCSTGLGDIRQDDR